MEDFIAQAAILVPALLVLGLVSGVLAGLLGIGGGIVLVPGLYHLFSFLGYDESLLMHMAVGTSLAIILPTGISSARAHHRKKSVSFDLVGKIGPGIVAGVMMGTWIADGLKGESLVMIFAGCLVFFAVLMNVRFRENGTSPSGHRLRQPFAFIGGGVIGGLSALMGIGGATLNVPFMTMHGVPIHRAIGSSSAMGPLIALPGAIGFIIIGWNETGLPPLSMGYVNLLALAMIAPASVLAAPYGAHLAHTMNVRTLKAIFSFFLIIVAMKMMWDALHG